MLSARIVPSSEPNTTVSSTSAGDATVAAVRLRRQRGAPVSASDTERGAGLARERHHATADHRTRGDVVVDGGGPEEVAPGVDGVEALVGRSHVEAPEIRVEPGRSVDRSTGMEAPSDDVGAVADIATTSPRSEATTIVGGSVGTNTGEKVGGEIEPLGVAFPTRPSVRSPTGAGVAAGAGRHLVVAEPCGDLETRWMTPPSASRSSCPTMPTPAHARVRHVELVAQRLGDLEPDAVVEALDRGAFDHLSFEAVVGLRRSRRLPISGRREVAR